MSTSHKFELDGSGRMRIGDGEGRSHLYTSSGNNGKTIAKITEDKCFEFDPAVTRAVIYRDYLDEIFDTNYFSAAAKAADSPVHSSAAVLAKVTKPKHDADSLAMKGDKTPDENGDVVVKEKGDGVPAKAAQPDDLPDHNPALLTKAELDEIYKTKDYFTEKYKNLDAETLDFLDNTAHRHNLEINPPLRQAYEREVYNLKELVMEMRLEGKNWEGIFDAVSPLRRELGIKYKNLTPVGKLQEIIERNMRKYGDPLGPTKDYFIKNNYSWKKAVEGACIPDGGDIKF